VFECRIWIVLDQRCATHDHARSAESALERIVLDERRLHRMKLLAGREAFDGRDLVRRCIDSQRQAGADRSLIEPYGASAARSAITDDLRSSQPQIGAQSFSQRGPRLNIHLPCLAVY